MATLCYYCGIVHCVLWGVELRVAHHLTGLTTGIKSVALRFSYCFFNGNKGLHSPAAFSFSILPFSSLPFSTLTPLEVAFDLVGTNKMSPGGQKNTRKLPKTVDVRC